MRLENFLEPQTLYLRISLKIATGGRSNLRKEGRKEKRERKRKRDRERVREEGRKRREGEGESKLVRVSG